MRTSTIALIFGILLGTTLSAQYSIEGLVTRMDTKEVIAGVEIFIEPDINLISTDETGVYRFEDLKAGNYQISVFGYEYNYYIQEIELTSDTIINIQLEPLSQQLSAVQIKARKEALFNLKKLAPVEGTAIFSGKKSEVVLVDQIVGSLASNNARQLYAQVVGLNIYENNDAGLQLNIGGRGLDPNRSSNFNTRQNGYDISADVLGYPESYYTPPSEAIEEIQVVRGAASLQYGTQFGGLINFKLKKPTSDKKIQLVSRQTTGSFGLFTSFNSIEGTLGNLSYYGFFNYKRGNGYRENSAFDSKNGYGYIAYDFSDKSKLSIEYTHLNYLAQQAGGLTDAQFEDDPRQSNRSRNWFAINWNLYQALWQHEFDNGWRWSSSIFGLDAGREALGFRGNPINLNSNPVTELDEQSTNGDYINERDLIRGTFKNWGMEHRLLIPFALGDYQWTSLFGMKYYDANNSGMQGPASKGVDADFSFRFNEFPDYANQSDFAFPNRNISLFSEHIFRIGEKLFVSPGIRYEYIKTESLGSYNQVVFDNAGNPIFNETLSDDRSLSRRFALLGLSVSYQKSPQMEWYGNFSQNYRSVTFSDIRVVSPTFIIDPDIKDEEGFTLDIGVRGRVGQTLSYDVSAFGLLYDDRIGIILDNRANRVRKNIGQAGIIGIESLLDLNILRLVSSEESDYRLKAFTNFALTKSQFLQSEENNVEGKELEFIPLVNFKTGVEFGYKNLISSLQFGYLSEQYTDVENSAAPEAGDLRAGVIGTIPAYHILDFSTVYRQGIITVETGILNLLNTSYYTRRATGYPGPGIIPSDGRSVYLTVGVKI